MSLEILKTNKMKKKPKLGRKKVDDKKLPITIYVQESKIKKLGGAIEVRELLLKTVEEANQN